MDPIHLTTEEIEYELSLRNVFNLTSSRARTAALRERMIKEKKGTEPTPQTSSVLDVKEDIIRCADSYCDIISKAEEAMKSGQPAELSRCMSRLTHIKGRLERLNPSDEEDKTNILELLGDVNDAIPRISRQMGNKDTTDDISCGPQPTRSDRERASISKTPPVNSSREVNDSINNISGQINALNFSNISEEGEGAVGGTDKCNDAMNKFELLSVNDQNNIIRTIRDQIINAGLGANQTKAQEINNRSSSSYVNPFRQSVSTGPREIAVIHNQIERTAEPTQVFRAPNINAANVGFPYRRTVPINQWGIYFSGDGSGLHLYDFLAQVALLKRAENVTDEDMAFQIIHLLTGRARLWYLSKYDEFRNWDQVVLALKREFLPSNYDYLLFGDISNRKQKEKESFGEYITHMQALFKCLSTPLDEGYKLFIVQQNLLPHYAASIAPLELRNLDDLSSACRRIDNATGALNRQSFTMPFQQKDTRKLFAIGQTEQAYNTDVHRSNLINRSGYSAGRKCWNCGSSDHGHRECNERWNGIFCFKCGMKEVVAKNCPRCSSENDGANRQLNGPVADSQVGTQIPE